MKNWTKRFGLAAGGAGAGGRGGRAGESVDRGLSGSPGLRVSPGHPDYDGDIQ